MADLEQFLHHIHYIMPNLNDTFGYAMADSEKIEVGEGAIMALWYERHGWYGLVAITAYIRSAYPIEPVANHPAFVAAMRDLHGKEAVTTEKTNEVMRWVEWFDLEDKMEYFRQERYRG